MAKLFSEIVDYRVRDEFGGETLRLLRVLFQNRDRACHAEARRRREGADPCVVPVQRLGLPLTRLWESDKGPSLTLGLLKEPPSLSRALACPAVAPELDNGRPCGVLFGLVIRI